MNYRERELERKFTKMSNTFKAVFVTGARQTGKTTLLKHLCENQNRTYVTLDNMQVREMAQNDPVLFFQTYKTPILIDEIQKAPQLFEQIKIICDNSDEKGLFWITGSQQYKVMKNIQDSLAGRVGILKLYPYSQREINGVKYKKELDFSLENLIERQKQMPKNNIEKIFNMIWQGMMPGAQDLDEEMKNEYYESYINTYLMRDVLEEGGITDSIRFRKFLEACSALVSEQVNYQTLANAANISVITAKKWLDILVGLNIIILVEPYYNNELKRLAKTPKMYFYDTGLCSYLSMWLTPGALRLGAANGDYFENYVLMELLKNYAYGKEKVNITYLRDNNDKEIDFIIEKNNKLYPLEVKLSAMPNKNVIKKFDVLEKTKLEIGDGGIICMCEEPMPINEKNNFIPCNLI